MDAIAVVAGLLHELAVPDAALSLIVAHARAVARDADRLGLVAERGLEAILLRHSADSLLFALARRPAPGEEWMDVGSGAGFPGFVLAAAFPETRFLLVEPQQRRAGFLELEALNIGCANATVVRERVERLPSESADVVTARALENPGTTIPELRRLLRDDGASLVAIGVDAATPAVPAAAPKGGATWAPVSGDGPAPVAAEVVDVKRHDVDSPGRVLMIRKTT
jgi:16S rRNA (guanine527-N7)-methyltransferase